MGHPARTLSEDIKEMKIYVYVNAKMRWKQPPVNSQWRYGVFTGLNWPVEASPIWEQPLVSVVKLTDVHFPFLDFVGASSVWWWPAPRLHMISLPIRWRRSARRTVTSGGSWRTTPTNFPSWRPRPSAWRCVWTHHSNNPTSNTTSKN